MGRTTFSERTAADRADEFGRMKVDARHWLIAGLKRRNALAHRQVPDLRDERESKRAREQCNVCCGAHGKKRVLVSVDRHSVSKQDADIHEMTR